MHLVHVSHARDYRGGDRQMELLIDALGDYPLRQTAIVRAPQTAERLRALGHVAVVEARSPIAALRSLRGADLCHAHCGRAVQTAALAKLRFGATSVATRRIAKPPRSSMATRWLYRRVDALAAVSAAVASQLRDYDPKLRPRIVKDGVSADWLKRQPSSGHDMREQLPESARHRFLIGQVAALDDRDKGQRLLLKVAARLLLSRPDMHFVLIGDGPDRESLQRELACLPNVTLVGWQDDMAGWYEALDALVAPSRREGLGGAIIEAMQFGLPVVASRVGGIPELIDDGENGLTFEPGDTRKMQALLERLESRPGLRARLGAAAQERARQLDVARMVRGYLAIYAAVDERFESITVDATRRLEGRQNRQSTPAAGKIPSQASSDTSSSSSPASLVSTS